jgi:hypothetical protein
VPARDPDKMRVWEVVQFLRVGVGVQLGMVEDPPRALLDSIFDAWDRECDSTESTSFRILAEQLGV